MRKLNHKLRLAKSILSNLSDLSSYKDCLSRLEAGAYLKFSLGWRN